MSEDEQARMPQPQWPRTVALIVTNLTKLAGAAIAFNEVVLRPELRPLGLAVAAFMMAGAQVSETAVLHFIDRFLGREVGQE